MNQPQPSRVRFLVVFVTFLAAMLLYLDRFCISYTQRYIKEDLGLTEFQFSLCLSAFFWAYALGQVPSGWLSDRFGARWMLSIYIVAWSAFTALVGLASGFVMLVLLRVALGLGQAGAYPTSAGLVRNWVPTRERGKANSIVAFGGRLGGFLAPILTAYLVISFVPLDVSSRLTSADLLDAHYLCYQLTEPEADQKTKERDTLLAREKIVNAVAASCSTQAITIVQRLADEYRREFAHQHPDGSKDVRKKYDPAIREHLAAVPDVDILLDQMNVVIQKHDFHGTIDWDNLSLEDEAKSFRKLNQLTASQQERLNRLVLEAVFPKAVRKIYVHGWRRVMFVYGSLGAIVAALFWLCFRNQPRDHAWCNDAEVALIEGDQPKAKDASRTIAIPFKAMVRSRSLWLMCVNQFGGNVGWIFLMTWLPLYLLDVHSVPFVQRGWMAAIPLSVGWIGMLAGGWATDRMVSQFGLRWRMAPVVLGRAVAMVAYLACLFAPSPWFAIVAFSFIALANDFTNPASWAYKQDVGGRNVAAIHGWANMWGNFGAAMSPILLERVITIYGWNAAFITGAVAFLIAGIAALGVDARIPIESEPNVAD